MGLWSVPTFVPVILAHSVIEHVLQEIVIGFHATGYRPSFADSQPAASLVPVIFGAGAASCRRRTR